MKSFASSDGSTLADEKTPAHWRHTAIQDWRHHPGSETIEDLLDSDNRESFDSSREKSI